MYKMTTMHALLIFSFPRLISSMFCVLYLYNFIMWLVNSIKTTQNLFHVKYFFYWKKMGEKGV